MLPILPLGEMHDLGEHGAGPQGLLRACDLAGQLGDLGRAVTEPAEQASAGSVDADHPDEEVPVVDRLCGLGREGRLHGEGVAEPGQRRRRELHEVVLAELDLVGAGARCAVRQREQVSVARREARRLRRAVERDREGGEQRRLARGSGLTEADPALLVEHLHQRHLAGLVAGDEARPKLGERVLGRR